MLKILKWVGIVLGGLLLLLVLIGVIISKPLPEGKECSEAEDLARKVEKAINKEAWDTTAIVQWTFMGAHDFLWDKERNLVKVNWKSNEVLLNLNTLAGVATKNGKALSTEKNEKMVQKAWALFANDSFWLNAPAKVFDPGTKRGLVELEDGRQGLLVTYTSGGVTPGDSYLWLLDDEGLPEAWRMWVQILPIGGLKISWEEWQTLPTGAKIATAHQPSPKITNLKGAASMEAFGLQEDPFAGLQ